jgi:hypothetical protein
MAKLLGSDDLTYISVPITKFTEDADGNLVVEGVVTDGGLDSDKQVADPAWSRKALTEWMESETGPNLRVMHSPNLYPAGRGLEVTLGDNEHRLKALVVEDTAKKLVRNRVLTAYSIGIANPVIERDVTGKARNGVIRGGSLAEVSLVDRPANGRCRLTLSKSVDLDVPWTVGDLADLLAKAEAAELAKGDGSDDGDEPAEPDDGPESSEAATDEPSGEPADAEPDADEVSKAFRTARTQWLSREPGHDHDDGSGTAFLAKMAARAAWQRWDAEGDEQGLNDQAAWVAKRDIDPTVGGGVDRDTLPAEDFVDSEGRRFPVVTPGDVPDAVSSYGRADPLIPLRRFRRRLTAIARRKGPEFVAALPQSWDNVTKDITTTTPLASGLAPYNLAGSHPLLDDDEDRKDDVMVADLVKAAKTCRRCGTEHADSKLRRCESCGKKLPKVEKALLAELVKVGPKGYEHGWVFVGVPGAEAHHPRGMRVGAQVHHPEHGSGTVKRVGAKTVTVQHHDGERRAYDIGHVGDATRAGHFAPRGHPDLISRDERDRRSADRIEQISGEAAARARRVKPSKKERKRGVASPQDVERRNFRRTVEQGRAGEARRTAERLRAELRDREATKPAKAPKTPKLTPEQHVDRLSAMGSRDDAHQYMAGVKGKELDAVARHLHAHFAGTAAERRHRVVDATVGVRLDSAAIRGVHTGRAQHEADMAGGAAPKAVPGVGVRRGAHRVRQDILAAPKAERAQLIHDELSGRSLADARALARELGVKGADRSDVATIADAVHRHFAEAPTLRRVKSMGADMAKKRRDVPVDEPDEEETEAPDEELDDDDDGDAVMKSYTAQRMHDALCPGYGWPQVTQAYPALTSVADALDPSWFDLSVLKAAETGDTTAVVWAGVLRDNADAITTGAVEPAALADARAELCKAFGPPPSPEQFDRDYLAAGRAPLHATATSQPPAVPAGTHTPDPDDFHRGLITQGHQAASPSDAGDNLDPTGSLASGASRTYYRNATREAARNAMAAMHDHIAATFPDMCQMARSRDVMPAGMGATNRPHPVQPLVTGETTKTFEPDGLTKRQLAKLVKTAVADATTALRDGYEARIEEMRQQIDELGSQPDLAQAPLRGAVTKASTAATAVVEKTQQPQDDERAAQVDFARRFLGHPTLGHVAEANLRALLGSPA